MSLLWSYTSNILLGFYKYSVPTGLPTFCDRYESDLALARIRAYFKTAFHGCKLLMEKEMIKCRYRVHFAGSVAA